MKNIISLLILVLITVFYSCDDAFTTIKEIELPEHEQKLSVFVDVKANKAKIFISHSKSMDDNSAYTDFIANVSLFKEGVEILNFDYNTVDNKTQISTKYIDKVEEGLEYKLLVDSDKFGTASAVQLTPKKPNVRNIVYKKDWVKNKYDNEYDDRLEFKLGDEKGVDNYYFVQLLGLDSIQYGRDSFKLRYVNMSINEDEGTSIRNVYDENWKGIIFSDKNFDGVERDMKLNISNYNYNPGSHEIKKYKLVVNSITKDLYNYLLSKEYAEESEYNPFAEPVNVHSNIENGYGLFSAEVSKEWEFEVE